MTKYTINDLVSVFFFFFFFFFHQKDTCSIQYTITRDSPVSKNNIWGTDKG